LLAAVILMVLPAPEVEILAPEAKPVPLFPWPRIEVVAVIFPVVVRPLPAIWTPSPPLLPLTQFENITSPLAVKPFNVTPWLETPLPPLQLEKVTVPVVPVLQLRTDSLTPRPEEAVLVPLKVIFPEVLVIALVLEVACKLIAFPVPGIVIPVRKIFPVAVVMEGMPTPPLELTKIPVLPVPFNVMLPPPVVDI
jgi:hypothetical protein